jgi:hypothetical protein
MREVVPGSGLWEFESSNEVDRPEVPFDVTYEYRFAFDAEAALWRLDRRRHVEGG